MLTRAKVIKQINSYKWLVNIPILNGIPDSEEEKTSLNSIVTSLNSELPEDASQKEQVATVKKAYEKWNEGVKSFNGFDSNGIKTEDWIPSSHYYEFTMEASLCGIGGMSNSIHVGDIVIVGFEDNDMGSPIILGHLLTDSLEQKRSNYSQLNLQGINILNSAKLPSDLTIKIDDKGTTISLKDLLNIVDFYNSLNSVYPGNGLISLLQKLEKLLPST